MENWLEVTVETSDAQMEELAARLTMNGAEGLVLEDEAEFKTFLEENRQYWDYVDDELLERMRGVARIKFYVTDDADGRAQMDRALTGIDNPRTIASLKEEDWAYGWQKYYQPMTVGERLYIVPEWERGKPVPAGRVPVYLNPGLTFGTGSHASTQLCLGLLEERISGGERVLDLGCGSGILGIGALVLGAVSCLGCDIDPKAPDVVLSNAALNGIGPDRLQARAGDIISDGGLRAEFGGGYDLVLANIVSDVIIPLSPFVPGFMAPGGVFITSGIIEGRQDEVRAAMEAAGLKITKHCCQEEWHCFTAVLA